MSDFTQEENKLRGGYYTPDAIASFLVKWALKDRVEAKILEPSMGDGIFIDAIKSSIDNSRELGIDFTGIELFESEYKKATIRARGKYQSTFNLINNDFFSEYDNLEKFDVIIGNPPFIRYQSFPEEHRSKANEILNRHGFSPNRMTNAWAFFLLASIKLLKDRGKLAMVIPAELLQVKYAQETREFISKFFERTTIVTFENLVFDNIQQEVVLLLCEKDSKLEKGIDLVELVDHTELDDLLRTVDKPGHFKPIDHETDKWIQYLLSTEDINTIKKLKQSKLLTPLGKVLDVDVGVVTGNNKFFVLDEDTVCKYNLEKFVVRLVGRSKQLNGGVIFHGSDWEEYRKKNHPVFLLDLKDVDVSKHQGLTKYLELGIREEIHKGYKCRIRKNWYEVPSIWLPELLMLRQIHEYPRFIYNETNAVPTDTIHRVKIFEGYDAKKITVSFLNSVSFAFTEILGRSYGGGVLEIEPNEVDNIPIPYIDHIDLDLEFIDKLLREKGISEVVDYIDKRLLIDELGFSPQSVKSINTIWRKLSNRRLKRGRSK